MFLQNHDQVANSAAGAARPCADQPRPLARDDRVFPADAGHSDAVSGPGIRRLDARSSISPTIATDLVESVREGRAEFLAQFPSIADPEMQRRLADPADEETFRRCRARSRRARAPRAGLCAAPRPARAAPRRPGARAAAGAGRRRGDRRARLDAAVFRRGYRAGRDRLLLVNLGTDLTLAPMPEPLLAPLEDRAWQILWSSEQPAYGGGGTPPLVSRRRPAHPRRERARPGARPADAGSGAGTARRKQADRAAGRRDENEVLRVIRDENPKSGRAARMARDERARRLRLGDGVRRDRAALSRFSDRGACRRRSAGSCC